MFYMANLIWINPDCTNTVHLCDHKESGILVLGFSENLIFSDHDLIAHFIIKIN